MATIDLSIPFSVFVGWLNVLPRVLVRDFSSDINNTQFDRRTKEFQWRRRRKNKRIINKATENGREIKATGKNIQEIDRKEDKWNIHCSLNEPAYNIYLFIYLSYYTVCVCVYCILKSRRIQEAATIIRERVRAHLLKHRLPSHVYDFPLFSFIYLFTHFFSKYLLNILHL